MIVLREPKTEADLCSLSSLAEQLAAYHNETACPDPLKLKADADWYSSRIVSVDGVDVGFVGWHRFYACHVAERGIELQNLYVDSQFRGQGLGFKLVLEVVQDALKLDCARIKIGAHKENLGALEFYKKLGCIVSDRGNLWGFKLERDQMKMLVERAEAGVMKDIAIVDLSKVDRMSFKKHLADSVILTADNRILCQKRPANWRTHPNVVNIFGGHVEVGETIVQALIRELAEETGAKVFEQDVTFIAAMSEAWTEHTELVHVHFWHDKENTITGCYEAESILFDTVEEAVAHPKMMEYARLALKICQERGLFKMT